MTSKHSFEHFSLTHKIKVYLTSENLCFGTDNKAVVWKVLLKNLPHDESKSFKFTLNII